MTISHIHSVLPLYPIKDLGVLVAAAAKCQLMPELDALLDYIEALQVDPDRMSSAGFRQGVEILSRQGQWTRCARLINAMPEGHHRWAKATCWEVACKQDDISMLQHLGALNMEETELPMRNIIEAGAHQLFEHALIQCPEMLPNAAKDRSTACAAALRMGAHVGQRACERVLALMSKCNLPPEQLQQKLLSINTHAWNEVVRTRDETAAKSLLSMGLNGGGGVQWQALFRYSDIGTKICQDARMLELLCDQLSQIDSLAVSAILGEIDVETAVTMDQAGLPVLDLCDHHAQTIAHYTLRDYSDNDDLLPWLMLRAPHLLVQRDTQGSTPIDMMPDGWQKTQALGLVRGLEATFQAVTLDEATCGSGVVSRSTMRL